MVTVASEGPVCVGWRHWWAATLSNGPGEAGDSRGATWAMLRSRRPGGWTAGRRGEAGGGRGQPCARRACEGSAATACAAAGELLRRLWLGQRHPYDWGHRWERRRRVLGGDWGVGAPRERPSEVPRCRGHDGVVETAAGTFLHAARAVSERQSGPSMGAERWGTLTGQQALCVGGWGGWRCAPARRPRRPDEVLDGDGSPRGGRGGDQPVVGVALEAVGVALGQGRHEVLEDNERQRHLDDQFLASSKRCRRPDELLDRLVERIAEPRGRT